MIGKITLVILAILATASAQSESSSCGQQFQSKHQCLARVYKSPAFQAIATSKKQAIRSCIPNFSQECYAKVDAYFSCMSTVQSAAQNDPNCEGPSAQAGINQCFQQNPPDPMLAFAELFMKPMNSSKMCPGGGQNGHQEPEKTDDNKCAETDQQKQCISAALQKDANFINNMNLVMKEKMKCMLESLSWSCTPKSPQQMDCIMNSMKPCMQASKDRLNQCVSSNGGPASSGNNASTQNP